jgi:hypothetical protein
MGAYRHRATWRQTTFNEQFFDVGAAVDDPVALDQTKLYDSITLDTLDIQRVSAQDYRELRQYLEGAEPNEAYEGVRAINGTGVINATSLAQLEDKRWALNEQFGLAACRIAALATDPIGVLPFDFKRDSVGGTKALRFYARPGPARPIWVGRRGEGKTAPYSFQLIAFDPFAVDVALTTTALGNLVGGANTVTNPGNIYSKPKYVITFSGAGAASVVLTNVTTGQAFTMNLSAFVNTNVLTLDVARATMTKQDGTEQYDKRIAGYLSQMFLQAGANSITWSSATGISSVAVQHRGTYS